MRKRKLWSDAKTPSSMTERKKLNATLQINTDTLLYLKECHLCSAPQPLRVEAVGMWRRKRHGKVRWTGVTGQPMPLAGCIASLMRHC
jgi:hypothetical protein